MSSVTSLRRPSAADVRPGTELYERIIRALRGEHQWTKTCDTSRVERRYAVVKESSNAVANVTQRPFPAPFNTNCSEILPSVETPPLTPPLKRPCHVHNAGQTATVEKYEQEFETTNEAPAKDNVTAATAGTDNTIMELPSEQNVAVTSPVKRPTSVQLDNNGTQTVQCAIAQKLQKISQVDKTRATETKPWSKYKPPYKIEKSSKPSRDLHPESVIN